MKLYLILITACLSNLISFTQEDHSKNNIYVEFLGKGFFYSINYEREVFQINDLIGCNLSAGLGIFPGPVSYTHLTLPTILLV